MISKIKDLLAAKELIDQILEKVNQNTQAVSDLTTESGALKKSLHSLREKEVTLLSGLEKDIKDIASVKEDFSKALYEFKLFKVEMQKKLLDKYDKQLQKELHSHLDTLNNDARHYNDGRLRLTTISKNLETASADMQKLLSISKKIEKSDFELNKYAKNLMENDKEKLRLMQKIDGLERLVASLRRRR